MTVDPIDEDHLALLTFNVYRRLNSEMSVFEMDDPTCEEHGSRLYMTSTLFRASIVSHAMSFGSSTT